jgi:hypothetical protein
LKVLVAAVLASPVLAAGQPRYAFTGFDVPGAQGTDGVGINNLGAIVGFAFDGTTQHGFL